MRIWQRGQRYLGCWTELEYGTMSGGLIAGVMINGERETHHILQRGCCGMAGMMQSQAREAVWWAMGGMVDYYVEAQNLLH